MCDSMSYLDTFLYLHAVYQHQQRGSLVQSIFKGGDSIHCHAGRELALAYEKDVFFTLEMLFSSFLCEVDTFRDKTTFPCK